MGKSGCSHGPVAEEAYQQQTNPEREEEHVFLCVCVWTAGVQAQRYQ